MTTPPRVLVLRAPGTNCDEETAFAWERAGAAPETWHVRRLLDNPAALKSFQILTIPGGFSYGDDLGAGRIFAARLGAIGEALTAFRDGGGLLLGICNGFQVLVRAGLLPGTGRATLTYNDSARFEARWVRLRPRTGRCVFLADDEPIELPVAHGEGKFLTERPDDLHGLDERRQIALQYIDDHGQPTQSYPANPNGSPGAVAGVCDHTGRVFGLMPHPERAIDPLQHPDWTRQGPRPEGNGLRVFRNAVRALA